MGAPATEMLVRAAAVRPGMRVLDLASGTGEPGLSLAPLVLPGGEVAGIDVAAAALAIARERALERGYGNLHFQQADVHNLPFQDSIFDVVTSRLGIMFFSDLPSALAEIRRVLRPGGHLALLAWGPLEEQDYFTSVTEALLAEFPGASIPEGALEVFKFGAPGTLSGALRRASFRDVREESRSVPWVWPGTPAEVLDYFQAAAAPFRPLFEELPAEQRQRLDSSIIRSIAGHYDGSQVKFTSRFVLVTAAK